MILISILFLHHSTMMQKTIGRNTHSATVTPTPIITKVASWSRGLRHWKKRPGVDFFDKHCGDQIILPGRQNWWQFTKILPKAHNLTVWNSKMWLGKIQTTCCNILPPRQNSPAPAVKASSAGLTNFFFPLCSLGRGPMSSDPYVRVSMCVYIVRVLSNPDCCGLLRWLVCVKCT